MRLLIKQKNELYDLIESADLSPNTFEIVEILNKVTNKIGTKIIYKGKDYHFIVQEQKQYEYTVTYSPGETVYSERVFSQSWIAIAASFRNWLVNIKSEIKAIDKWKRLKEEIHQIDISFANESDKFSASEYENLKKQMMLLKDKINNIDLLPEQITIIEKKIDHLTEIAQDLSKFDWKGLFVGTFVSIIIQLGVTQENAKALWDLIKSIFNKHFLIP